jgi:hypothetical protein
MLQYYIPVLDGDTGLADFFGFKFRQNCISGTLKFQRGVTNDYEFDFKMLELRRDPEMEKKGGERLF